MNKQQPGGGECPAPRPPAAAAGGGPGQGGGSMRRRPLALLPFLSLRDYVFCMATLLLFCSGSLFYQLNGGPPDFLLALRHCLGKGGRRRRGLVAALLHPPWRLGRGLPPHRGRGGGAGAAGGRGCRAGWAGGSADTGAGPAGGAPRTERGGAPRHKFMLPKAESPRGFLSPETALRPRAALCVPGDGDRARCAGSSGRRVGRGGAGREAALASRGLRTGGARAQPP